MNSEICPAATTKLSKRKQLARQTTDLLRTPIHAILIIKLLIFTDNHV